MSQKVAGTKSCEVANISGRKKEVNVAGIKHCETEKFHETDPLLH